MFIKNILIIYCNAIVFLSSCNNDHSNNMKFILFNPACTVDTLIVNGNIYHYKTDAYLMNGYKNTQSNEITIDSFVCKVQDSLLNQYGEYHILFYRESKITNNEHILNRPRDLFRYSQENDLLFEYIWREGEFMSKYIHIGQIFSKQLNCN